ncbi:TonB-dependent receptor plug domain-containing protein [Gloeobacter morelensis]|uniref:TonB-dependent receptor plug domain-containing protein n=1 Tax=Gloeobacter morelensis MG652769 TaxID=2781736 RepID=A0ABY3PTD9_9CYAN|nr:TonB-dependent receptor plug domain-containing protein [Gloeobacter morelensis]UFP96753.1 TonB-dependent receptor plug domain-containing protein [Gloeobacter morelensis MG652769]
MVLGWSRGVALTVALGSAALAGGAVRAEQASDLLKDQTQAQGLIEPAVVGEDLPEVTVTASKSREEQVFRVPLPVTVLSQQRASERDGTTIVDLLKGETGVWVQSSGPGQGTPFVRGVTGREVLLLQDGFRISPAFIRSGPNQYLALLDPYAFERLEVARGPVSVLYGSDALGGAVNVVGSTPQFTGEATQAKGRVYAGYGTANAERSGRLEVSRAARARLSAWGSPTGASTIFTWGAAPTRSCCSRTPIRAWRAARATSITRVN